MKIMGKNPLIQLENYTKTANLKKKVKNSSGQFPREILNVEKVVLSPKAKAVQEAKKILGSVPDVREEKVNKLKKQIENGTYQVNDEKVAEKILKESIIDELL